MTTTQLSLVMNSTDRTIHAHSHVEETFEIGSFFESVCVVLQLFFQLFVEEFDDGASQFQLWVSPSSHPDRSEQVLQNHISKVHALFIQQSTTESLGDCLQLLEHKTARLRSNCFISIGLD